MQLTDNAEVKRPLVDSPSSSLLCVWVLVRFLIFLITHLRTNTQIVKNTSDYRAYGINTRRCAAQLFGN